MHPIFTSFQRLVAYLIGWIPIAALLAYLFAAATGIDLRVALLLAAPLCFAYAFVCLSAWYVCLGTPLGQRSLSRVALSQTTAALVATALWVVVAKVYAIELASTGPLAGLDKKFAPAIPVLMGTGTLLYMLSATSYYVFLAVQASHEAEARAIVAQVLAREAELKALKAQVNPHFLFNSLNSISALTGSDPMKAREMCILLGDFLRRTLGLGGRATIPLEEELSLIHSFIAVEKIRFGARLDVRENIDPGALGWSVPPLLLQPLVENAVVHGVANLVEGGWVHLEITAADGLVSVVVENQFDPEAPSRHRNGVGLANVRQRLDVRYGNRARLDVTTDGDRFRVAMVLPAEREERPA